MYLYFNSKGVLEEVVNDIPTRKDSSNVNHIYVYIDGVAYNEDDKYYPLPDSIESLSTRYQLPDGTITPVALVQGKVQQSIPYDKHRDMKCFKDFYNYEFFDIELPSGVNEDGSQSEIPNVLGQSGLVALTIIEQPVGLALGLVVFNVEQEVGITTDTLITEAQFNYLMGYVAKYDKQVSDIKTLIPDGTTENNKLTNTTIVQDMIDTNIPTFTTSTIWTQEFIDKVRKVGYAVYHSTANTSQLYSVCAQNLPGKDITLMTINYALHSILIYGISLNGTIELSVTQKLVIYSDEGRIERVATPINNSDAANKTYVDTTINQKIATAYIYKGSVQNYADLPTDANIGDVYNVIEAYKNYPAGTNFAWNGTQWDALGGSVDLSNYPTKEEVADDLSKKLDKVTTESPNNRIYAITKNGIQVTQVLDTNFETNKMSVPFRNLNGNFKVNTPVDGFDVSNKIYVDTNISEVNDTIENVNTYAQNTQQELNELKASLYGYVFGEDTANFSKLDISALPSMINNNNVAYNTRLMLDTIKGRTVKWTQLVDKSNLRHTETINGVTFTINKDNGRIICNGTATANISYIVLSSEPSLYLTPKSYILFTGCPSGGSENTYYLRWENYDINDIGNGVYRQLTALTDTTLVYVNLYIIIKSGTNMNGKIFSPQFFYVSDIYGLGKEPKTIADFNKDYPYSIYPYGKQEILTTKVSGIKIRAGYKNLLDKTKFAATQTINGVTFTNNGDGSYTLNGTATSYAYFTIQTFDISVSSNNSMVKYLMRGYEFEPGDITKAVSLYVDHFYIVSDSVFAVSSKEGNIVERNNIYNPTNVRCRIRVTPNYTCNNLVIRPQLINLTDTYGEGNEPKTPAQFNQDFPDIDNIPYEEQTISFAEQTLYGINTAQDTLQVVKENDGYKLQKVENIGNVDLGTLTWENGKTEDSSFIKAYLPMLNATYGTLLPYIVNSDYISTPYYNVITTSSYPQYNKSISVIGNGSYVALRDTSITDVSTASTTLSGKILYYAKRTPVTTTIATLTKNQVTALFAKGYCVEILGNDDNKVIVRPDLSLNMVIKLIGGNTNE